MIRQFRTIKGYDSITHDVREAMRLQGVPKRIRDKIGFNGAMPGDGVCWGSVTFPANAYGGMNALFRIYNVDDVRGRINDPEERRRLAADVRSYSRLLDKRLHPVSQLLNTDGLNAFDFGYSEDGEGVKMWKFYLAGGSQEVKVYERPEDRPRYMIRIENRSGAHINTLYAVSFPNLRAKLAGLGVPRACAYYAEEFKRLRKAEAARRRA